MDVYNAVEVAQIRLDVPEYALMHFGGTDHTGFCFYPLNVSIQGDQLRS